MYHRFQPIHLLLLTYTTTNLFTPINAGLFDVGKSIFDNIKTEIREGVDDIKTQISDGVESIKTEFQSKVIDPVTSEFAVQTSEVGCFLADGLCNSGSSTSTSTINIPRSTSQIVVIITSTSENPRTSASLPKQTPTPSSSSSISSSISVFSSPTPTTFSTLTSTSSSTQSSSTPSNDLLQIQNSQQETSSSNAGKIAGAVLGTLGGIAVIIAISWFILSRKRKQMDEERMREKEVDIAIGGNF